MMDTLPKEDLRYLMEARTAPCVSMFLPMERTGKETRQNAIRFKNMLRESEERLQQQGMESTESSILLKPAADLLSDELFWQHQSDGLAVFIARDTIRLYRLPLDFAELLVVADRFHIKPLLRLYTCNSHFYLLALSQNQIRLLHGTRYSVEELELPSDMPTSIQEVLAYDDPERQLHSHTPGSIAPGDSGAQGAGTPLYHGHADADERTNILRYFLEVNRHIHEVLKNEQTPLVLAGVEELLSLYHDRNTYPYLVEKGVIGNPDALKPEELHAQAWDVIEPYLQQQQQARTETYHDQKAANRATSDLREVVPAAVYGRIDSLFVAVDRQQWGKFDPFANSLQVNEQEQAGREEQDLLDLAAVHTLANSGTVYAVPTEQVPDKAALAAILRY